MFDTRESLFSREVHKCYFCPNPGTVQIHWTDPLTKAKLFIWVCHAHIRAGVDG